MPSKPVNKEAPLRLMLEDDTISLDEEDFHHHSAILDTLDQINVDEDPDANETNNDMDEIDVMSDSLPKMPSPPPTVVKKRKRGNFAHISRLCHSSLLCAMTVSGQATDDLQRPASVTKDISYMMSIFSAAEMKKAKSKREATAASVDLSSDEPWDTLKAQMLVKISKTIKPHILNFDDYTVTYQIPRVLPKPGLSLATQADFDGMMKRVNAMHASKSPLVNIVVVQEHAAANKNENDDDEDLENNAAAKAKNKKRVSRRLQVFLTVSTDYTSMTYPL